MPLRDRQRGKQRQASQAPQAGQAESAAHGLMRQAASRGSDAGREIGSELSFAADGDSPACV